MNRHGIQLGTETIQAFCRRRHIKSLYVFGSVLRDDFRPDSDIDFVIRMEDGVRLRFRELMEMEDELSLLVGRPVDIVLGTELDAPSANQFRKRRILASMEPLYGG